LNSKDVYTPDVGYRVFKALNDVKLPLTVIEIPFADPSPIMLDI